MHITDDYWYDDPDKADMHEKSVELIVACREFEAKFKTDAECIEELIKILGQANLYCRNCNSTELRRNYGSRTLLCYACRRGTSAFSGTIYDGIKKPRAWLLGHFLIGQGVEFNSNQFRIPARVAYSSALTIVKKMALIIKSDLENEVESVASNVFISVFNKRSSHTPAQHHPRAEQDEMEKSEAYLEDVEEDRFLDGEPIRPKCLDDLDEFTNSLYEMLGDEKIHFDDLLTGLNCTNIGILCTAIFTLDYLSLIQRHGGDYYTRKQKPAIVELPESTFNANVRDFIEYIKNIYHGISRKCLHLYLALFWSKNYRVRWNRSALAKACREHPRVTGKQVLSFVTPLIVNLVGLDLS
jgi:hypothetical protein